MGLTTVTDPDTAEEMKVAFRRRLSITWADIVAHPDTGERRKYRAAGTGVDYAESIRLTDPRRMAVYFASSKLPYVAVGSGGNAHASAITMILNAGPPFFLRVGYVPVVTLDRRGSDLVASWS
jgi:hypothetical protein